MNSETPASSPARVTLRELIEAIPIVTFARALVAAFASEARGGSLAARTA